MLKRFIGLLALMAFCVVVWVSFNARGNDYSGLFHLPSFLTVGIGHLLIVLYSYPLNDIYQIWREFFRVSFGKGAPPFAAVMSRMVAFSKEFHQSGQISVSAEEKSEFLKKAASLINNNYEKEEIQRILANHWRAQNARGMSRVTFFDYSAKIAPALGMMGTILGLVSLLQNMEDYSKIGSGMALALLTTLYGLVISYAIYYPAARRLFSVVEEEGLYNAMIAEGIVLIKEGIYGPILREHLEAYLVGRQGVHRKRWGKSQKDLEPLQVEI